MQKVHKLIKIQLHISILWLQKFFQKNFRGPEVTSSGGYNANRNYKLHHRKLCNSSKWPLNINTNKKVNYHFRLKCHLHGVKDKKHCIICPEGANVTIFEYSPEGAQRRQIRESIRQSKKGLIREAPKGLTVTVMTNFLPEGQLSCTYSISTKYHLIDQAPKGLWRRQS